MVEHYDKGEVRELEPDLCPFGQEFSNATVMKVKPGSKLHSLVGYAEKQLQEDACRYVIFAGMGPACTKTISAVEVLKRRFKFELHQITKSRFKRVEEYWDPKVEGLERLKVNRDIPAIYVLLSKEALDTTDPGYQGPGYEVPLLQTDRPVYRRQQQQNRGRGGAGSSSQTQDRDGNKWKRQQKGAARDKNKPPKPSASSNEPEATGSKHDES